MASASAAAARNDYLLLAIKRMPGSLEKVGWNVDTLFGGISPKFEEF